MINAFRPARVLSENENKFYLLILLDSNDKTYYRVLGIPAVFSRFASFLRLVFAVHPNPYLHSLALYHMI